MSDFSTLPKLGQKSQITCLPAAEGWAVAQIAQAVNTARQTVVVFCAEPHEVSRLQAEVLAFAPTLKVAVFPDWETLPYDHFSPHQDLVSERLATLWQLSNGQTDVLIMPVSTALYHLPPVGYIHGSSFVLQVGMCLDVESLRRNLIQAGYSLVSQVYVAGECSVRGGLVDVYPMGSTQPFRLDLFGEEIESIRLLDVDTQRSGEAVQEIRLLPAREFPLDKAGQALFRQQFREVFNQVDVTRCALYKDVSAGLAPAGIEYYFPLFFEQTATIFDYLPPQTCAVLLGDASVMVQDFWRDAQARFGLLGGDKSRPILAPSHLFLSHDAFFAACKSYARFELNATPRSTPPLMQALPVLAIDRRSEQPLQNLQQFIADFNGRVIVLAESLGRREVLLSLCAAQGMVLQSAENLASALKSQAALLIVVAPLQQGFILSAMGAQSAIALITETELYANSTGIRSVNKRKKTAINPDALLRDLSEIKIGDPVVHENYGIGRYQGLENLNFGEGDNECMLLHYAGGDKLFVPVSHLYLISRYSGGDPDHAPLHKLGSGQWEKARGKAMQQVRDTAAELLNIYARRAARVGHAFQLDSTDYARFVAGFEYTETDDQTAAIEAVLSDMMAGRPMDRLVCGDVGFGKTEVALRAAFVAVMAGKQVAILVPTTLLAEQHYQKFCDRFADWPIKIAELSRFRSPKEVKAALAGLAAGQVDIVIGTHKLVQPDVHFHALGLVIIDEEHRFGVRHKEQFKALRAEVDMLTLTATPIPRTLGMALEGIRDFSVIATAPQKRLAVKTFVSQFNHATIREAVLREVKRGGQVFFLHNEVDTMRNIFERLSELLPNMRIAIAHGQMPERELEHVMREFTQGRFHVLLCSTIIETGIDIPNANTIIINRADKFGLAQLHQLRGRVGRSHHQAYAYLLTPEEESITSNAKKRLEAIQRMGDLGSGFLLAMHDLEIRGVGEVLGESQSGEMHEIGFGLYNDMLKHAVQCLKNGVEPDLNTPLAIATEINLHAPTLLPENYCPDVHERLVLYKRFANCSSADALSDLQQELIDRFGLLPEPAQTLLHAHQLRLACHALGIVKVDSHERSTNIQFMPRPPLDPLKILLLIQKQRYYKLIGAEKLRIEREAPLLADRLQLIHTLLKELNSCKTAI